MHQRNINSIFYYQACCITRVFYNASHFAAEIVECFHESISVFVNTLFWDISVT